MTLIIESKVDPKSLDNSLSGLSGIEKLSETREFKNNLIQIMEDVRDSAKVILEERSQKKTGKRYWTGELQDSIHLTAHLDNEPMYIRVGPDMRVAPHAEWVEFGHYRGNTWVEGYHYMRDAFLTYKDKIPEEVATQLAEQLKWYKPVKSRGTRIEHTRGRGYVSGFGKIGF